MIKQKWAPDVKRYKDERLTDVKEVIYIHIK